jgi:hypothetical protein
MTIQTTFRSLSVASLLLFVSSCQSEPATKKSLPAPPDRPASPAGAPPIGRAPRFASQDDLADGEVIRLDRSGCGFACPSYSIVIRSDGQVIYTGRAHTAVGGQREAQLDPKQLGRLLQTLAIELPPIAGRYTPGSKQCGTMRTDQPTVTLTARLDAGKPTQSLRYGGCPGAPRKLAELENLVDTTVDSGPWVSKRPMY